MSASAEVLLLGVSHKTAPVALRERVALLQNETEGFLQDLVSTPSIREAVAISTCNRTEIYLVVTDPVEAESAALGKLASRAGIRPTELAEVVYAPRNCDAARQLYRVASGLESMIVGEAEVQGQVRRAYDTAVTAGTSGPMTNRLFNSALRTGGRVRAETAIGAGGASVSSVAVGVASDVLGSLVDRHTVIIGAGETAELTAKALAAQGVTTMFVANRRANRARSLAERFGGEVLPLDELPEQLERADMVVSSTASPHAILGEEELALVMRARGGRPLLILDIAVPRDVEPGCGDLEGVTLIDVDGLQRVVRQNLRVREAEARMAERIVEEEIERFAVWLSTLDVMPTVAALRAHAEGIVDGVLAENATRWETDADRERAEKLARAVVNRLLHEPTVRLKTQGSHGRLQLARELFGLDEGASMDAADENVRPLRRPA
ncbi:MAG TPA: glutamyl-tRNA reductase [Solirubrobacteraceae bacterium]|nr:glutamyl-tRNA reductase [Solirubrobacteraceae bacterium]